MENVILTAESCENISMSIFLNSVNGKRKNTEFIGKCKNENSLIKWQKLKAQTHLTNG